MSKLFQRVATRDTIFQAQSICKLATARLAHTGDSATAEVVASVMDALDGAITLLDQAAAGLDSGKVRADAEVSRD